MSDHTDASKPGRRRDHAPLFQPGKIGPLELPNRLIMAAMGNALADAGGQVSEAMLEYYRPRAGGGVGLVITQFASVTEADQMPFSLGIYDDRFIPGLSRLVRTIHQAGAKAMIQLMHPGMLFLLFPSGPEGITIKVPSRIPRLPQDRPYHEFSEMDIEQSIEEFAAGAKRALAAGADGIELHACHGCLVSTFLSPAINRRTDQYGGSVENRARFARRIIEAVRREVGSVYPVIARINGCDDIDGGVSSEEAAQQAGILADAGATAISISSGIEYWSSLMAPTYITPEGVVIPVAEKIKTGLGLPVIVAGKIGPETAAQAVATGRADFIALGRPLLAEPDLPKHLGQGEHAAAPSCLYCNNCMISDRRSWGGCTVNPFLYREAAAAIEPADTPRKVIVIGGGLAGMWAALFAKRRGHDVSLYEKTAGLGGQWNVACALPGKAGYAGVTDYLKRALEHLMVPVTLNTEVTRELVAANQPDAVIVATGATPLSLDVPGGSGPGVVQANDVIQGKAKTGSKVVVVGGRTLGLETALMLAGQGKEVALVSHSALGGRRGPEEKIVFRGLVRRIIQERIPLYLNATVLEITAGSIILDMGQEPFSLAADTVVAAIGVTPVDSLVTELAGSVAEIIDVGDCARPGTAAQAALSAVKWAMKL